jgi:hypothetical protein
MSYTTPIGMQIARPGSITLDHYVLPSNSILGYRKYHENSPEFFHITNMSDYCFVTNYLGIVMSLYQELGQYLERANINVDYDYKKLGLSVSAVLMMWQDNLASVHTTLLRRITSGIVGTRNIHRVKTSCWKLST